MMKEIELKNVKMEILESVELPEDITSEDTRNLFSIGQLQFIENEIYQTLDVCRIWNIHQWQIAKAVDTGYVAVGKDGTKNTKRRYKLKPIEESIGFYKTFRGADLNNYFFYRWLSGRTLQEKKLGTKTVDSVTRLTEEDIKELANNFKVWKQTQIDKLELT